MGKLDGKVAIVTGAARGQGEAEARLFAAEGAKVVLGDVLDREGQAVADSIGAAAIYLHHDVANEESWKAVVGAAVSKWGRLDVLVNNAGILLVMPIAQMELADYMRIVGVNQVGCLLGMKHSIPAMAKGGGGSIVNISSTAGFEGQPGIAAYVSTKWAIRGLTRSAAIECGSLGIRVNSIHPGAINTHMGRGDAQGFEKVDSGGVFDKLPLGRIGEPIEIARLALFLASDDSSYCTGGEYTADGGWLTGRPMF
ncbi:MAG: glucose 1-dehydrogenase [Deltaproteobacteria bacterium]|nr:glucose 1-dehydrogenase [Deltaproteobacteria bacterium]